MKMIFNTDKTRFSMIFEKNEFQSAAQLMQMIQFADPHSVEEGVKVLEILLSDEVLSKPDLRLVKDDDPS